MPFYRNEFQKIGIMPEDIKSLDDLANLPFTTKDDLRNNYPYGLFAKPMSQIVRVHASSGTTGKPTVVGYSRNDITIWSEIVARSMVCAGADSNLLSKYPGYGLLQEG